MALALLCLWSTVSFGIVAGPPSIPIGPLVNGAPAVPDYNTTANWANSPPLTKFVDTLPRLGAPNNLGQLLTVGAPDTTTYPGSDYYEIHLVEFNERMHSDMPLPGTKIRGYVQMNKGSNVSSGTLPSAGKCGVDQHPCTIADNTVDPSTVHYLGPVLLAERNRPIRIKFTNMLPTGAGGDLFIPVDPTLSGAGVGPLPPLGGPDCTLTYPVGCASYTQNRATLHLHGGRTPWISDGTPHQWTTPATELTPYPKGVSVFNVPDMPDPGPGSLTFFYSNQQSARLMFYHDHAFGITRLNAYAGEAAGYVIIDQYELDLITRGIIPPLLDQIPLVIQDKTFVDATPVPQPGGGAIPKIRLTDPLWNWGSGTPDGQGVRPPVTGDFWLPHVYMPVENPYGIDNSGINPFGRWFYGPWFYPPTQILYGPIANPYYDDRCGSPDPNVYAQCTNPNQPPLIPATPSTSVGMEAFMDTMIVNGTAYPVLEVDARAYRFRILNACGDRGLNLSLYKAVKDPNLSPDGRRISDKTEVKMVPAVKTDGWPALWPTDGRVMGVPDPAYMGPSWLQIGTEGGFLPKLVERKPQPVTWRLDPAQFWFFTVKETSLGLMPAERADVIVDFTGLAGETLIVYNDAPAAWPAGDTRYDYYTGAPDQRDTGGYGIDTCNPSTGICVASGPLPGKGPNIRTVMQIKVRTTPQDVPYTFNRTNLEREFIPPLKTTPGLFQRAQDPIIVGQTAYKDVYPNSYFPPNYPWQGIAKIQDDYINFMTVSGKPVHVPLQPKAMHDEMGASFDVEYGRMAANLGMQTPNPTTLQAVAILYGYQDVPSEIITNSVGLNISAVTCCTSAEVAANTCVLPRTACNPPNCCTSTEVLNNRCALPRTPCLPNNTNLLIDGTQIWKISHNGVDTHPIHFHIFDVQLINRVGWDGLIALPDPNELGWKDTIKVSPLMDTIVAMRPVAPSLPFGLPNSSRPLNPALPIGSLMNFSQIDWTTGQAWLPTSQYPLGISNFIHDFKWEYVWHCHILSHEEMDMMRSIELNFANTVSPAPSPLNVTTAGVLTWYDPTPVNYVDPTTFGNSANEIGFRVERCNGTCASNGSFTEIHKSLANQTVYVDTTAQPDNTYSYRVIAYNAPIQLTPLPNPTYTTGDSVPTDIKTVLIAANSNPPDVSITSPASGTAFDAGSPIPIVVAATPASGSGASIVKVEFYADGTLIGTKTTPSAPDVYTLSWNNAVMGVTYILTAKATDTNGKFQTSNPVTVSVRNSPIAGVAPAQLNFGNQQIGTTSASQSVTLSNTGTVDLTYGTVITGTIFVKTSDICGGTVPANGGLCVISVTFTPPTTGTKTATLTINNNDPAHTPLTVALTGVGVQAPTKPTSLMPTTGTLSGGLYTLPANATSVTLTWVKPSNNAQTGYYLYRSVDGGLNWSLLATLASGSTSSRNTGLTRVPPTTYTYKIVAYNASGSAESNIINVRTR